jgi:hypothetical protein
MLMEFYKLRGGCGGRIILKYLREVIGEDMN